VTDGAGDLTTSDGLKAVSLVTLGSTDAAAAQRTPGFTREAERTQDWGNLSERPGAEPSASHTRRRLWSTAAGARWMLVGLLVLQALLGLRLIRSNTAFMDEALYLWAGHLELAHWLHGTPMPGSIQSFPTYFSGAPTIYPPLGALFADHGGLVAARLLSLMFTLGTTALLYGTASQLFGRAAAFPAAAMFVVFGPTQFLSVFATYDPMALFLLALSSWLVMRARGRPSELLVVLAALVLGLADATKYAVALWDPVVICLVILTAERGKFRALLRGARFAGYVAGPLVYVLLHFGGKPYVQGIMFTTLDRQAQGASSAPFLVLAEALSWLWPLLALAAVGVGVSFGEPVRTRLICLVLTGAALLAPLHQAEIHTAVSLQKHVVFGAWFGCMPGGYVLARAAQLCQAKGWRVIAAAVSVVAFAGIVQANALFPGGWPNMSKAIREIRSAFPGTRCPCLFTADNVLEYYMEGRFPSNEYGLLTGPFYFAYNQPGRRNIITGATAYVTAIRHHYFSIIEIDPAENPGLFRSAVRTLAETNGYHRTAVISIPHWSRKVIEIWRYEAPRVRNRHRPKLRKQTRVGHRRGQRR
jgi:hypothetical protein